MTGLLPIPTPSEVEEFRKIYFNICGVELDDAQALETATQVLQLYCLCMYGLPGEKRKDDKPTLSDTAS